MTPTLPQVLLDLEMAVAAGAAIGFERQWRNRLAGLRTNTLVALGSASFVLVDQLISGDASPTRVAAQVVSGIGFLGAGVIFREGLNVRGLNTAATLWCSAAVGLLAGAGFPLYALISMGFVIVINLLLRPIVSLINRQPLSRTELSIEYSVSVTCGSADEARIRALTLQALGHSTLTLKKLESRDLANSNRVEVMACLTSHERNDKRLEEIVGRLSLEPTVTAARWQAEPIIES
jgi:putative Mg2+ transporter-C (MgtC) family protein